MVGCYADVLQMFCERGKDPTRMRHERVIRTKPMKYLRDKKLVETTADDFFHALSIGTNSTLAFLQTLHNDALGMGWIATILGNGVRTILVESLDRVARDVMVQSLLLAKLAQHCITLVNCVNMFEHPDVRDPPLRLRRPQHRDLPSLELADFTAWGHADYGEDAVNSSWTEMTGGKFKSWKTPTYGLILSNALSVPVLPCIPSQPRPDRLPADLLLASFSH
jgi:hypothetical protein